MTPYNLDISNTESLDSVTTPIGFDGSINYSNVDGETVDYTKLADQGVKIAALLAQNSQKKKALAAETGCTPPKLGAVLQPKVQKSYEDCMKNYNDKMSKLKQEETELKRQELELRKQELGVQSQVLAKEGMSGNTKIIIGVSIGLLVLGIGGLVLYKTVLSKNK